MSIHGWKLDPADRAALLERFKPVWPDVVADHVTLAMLSDEVPLPAEVVAEIVGDVDDGEGLQALVVAVDGSVDRPDGSTYHITWSLDRARGRRAVESNAIIALRGWRSLDTPVPVRLHPAQWSA